MNETYKKILVPLDGSKLAEKSLPYAQDMAVRFSSEVVLLNARLPAEDPYHPTLTSYLDKMVKTIETSIQSHPPNNERNVGIEAVTVSSGELVRRPADDIVDYASNNDVNLIVMASHGHSGIKHWALGSVSDKVLHISDIPVLLVRARKVEYKRFNKILVPLDGSELAECVLPHVMRMATGYDSSEVVLLNVVEPLPPSSADDDNDYSEQEAQNILSRNKSSANKYLKEVAEKFGLKRSRIHSAVLMGNIAETIIDYAENSDIDLIIMSTHGHSGVSQWTLGSITERILHYSELPVLLVGGRGCKIS